MGRGVYSEGRFNGGFFALRVWGAYFWNFTVLTPKECKCEEFCLQTRLGGEFCSPDVIIHKGHYPSCPKPQFQSEAKCKAIDMYSPANKTHFHKKGFALSLVLKRKRFGNRRWSIAKLQALFAFLVCLIRDPTRSRFRHLTSNGKPRFAVSGFTLAVCPFLGLKLIDSLTFISAIKSSCKIMFQ